MRLDARSHNATRDMPAMRRSQKTVGNMPAMRRMQLRIGAGKFSGKRV